MAPALPDGEPAPADGGLPSSALAGLADRPLGVYVHVPFCAVRCGYCDFNTYTAPELAGAGGGASMASYVASAIAEVRLAGRVLGQPRPVDTVFFGGGTPTLLSPSALMEVLATIEVEFGLAPDVEVTVEANPESVSAASLAALRAGGFTRLSFGMQSAVPQVLRMLDRRHDPEGLPGVVAAARAAGFEQLSLDLIYGSPGETLADWRRSLDAAVGLQPDHVSAYALVVEEGTALARRVRRGEVAAPEEDDLADKYELADEVLGEAGFEWYEVSNWGRDEVSRCRHNLGYWRGDTWWGIGPGAHSHVSGVRWWNVKHPSAYAARLTAGASPAAAREVLDADTRRVERVLLESRLASGLPLELVGADSPAVRDVVRRGLATLSPSALTLTRRGRLLADGVVRALLE